MATYPGSVISFTTKVNNTDIVDASHVNALQLEMIAVQTYVGVDPNIASIGTSGGGGAGAWQNTATTYASLAARLNNIEAGVIGDAHTQYMKRAGGETITSATSSTKGLIVKGAASQSVNLQEWQNSAGTVLASVSAAGGIVDTKLTSDINNLYVLNYVFG
jgi:hypothetical protein